MTGSKALEVLNRAGIHARPASLISSIASKYKSDITIGKETMRINAKSIMGVITLGATYGTKLELFVEGDDEALAADAIETLFKNRFRE